MNYCFECKTDYENHNALLIISKSVWAKIRPIFSTNWKGPDPFGKKSFWGFMYYTTIQMLTPL